MINLDKKGYRISIGDWVGNLGNHLIQMSGALDVAKITSHLSSDATKSRLSQLTSDQPRS
jgi:hypothetical protein